jgi:gamma-glutamylcysteine synthetase
MAERFELHKDICRLGLRAEVRGTVILGMAQELVRIAREGLRRQGENLNLMEPLEELILKQGRTPAEVLLQKWEEWGHDIGKLVRYSSYFQQEGSFMKHL